MAKIRVAGLLAVLAAHFLTPQSGWAQVTTELRPVLIPVGGWAVTPSGEPRSGQVSLRLALYGAIDDRDPLATEDQVVTLGAGGAYQVWFGATLTYGLPVNLFTDGAARWVGVTVDQDPEQTRTTVVVVPYAARAASADALGTLTTSDFVLSENLRERLQDLGFAPSRAAGSGGDTITPSLSTGDTTSANAIPKYTDTSGTFGQAAMFETGGNVGIGTSSPEDRLHLFKSTNSALILDGPSTAAHYVSFRNSGSEFGYFGKGGSADNIIRLSGNDGLRLLSNGNNSINIATNGHVGVGTTSPSDLLHLYKATDSALVVDGPANTAHYVSFRDAGTEVGYLGKSSTTDSVVRLSGSSGVRLVGNGNSALNVDTSGNVGVGTTSPSDLLHLYKATNSALVLDGPSSAAHYVSFRNSGDEFGYFGKGGSADSIVRLSGNAGLRFISNGYSSLNLDTSGNVGIGTFSPTAKLSVEGSATVSGDVTVSGNIAAKYQDVAEWVDTPAKIEAGTVVIIDPDHNNNVVSASVAYDTRVAGAVSRQPGLILGEATANGSLVAQSGRVRIKVDASYGAIKIGDLLVTSPTAGHAMVSKPIDVGGVKIHQPGTVLGKALEAWSTGQGEILVLLTLQ